MKIGIIIQARMGSARLPGKVLKDLAGAPLLSRLIERVRRVGDDIAIVVATTTLPADDAIAGLATCEPGIALWRGSEKDVLRRYADAARHFGLDAVIRLTADNPLVDPRDIRAVLDCFLAREDCDYADNLASRRVPYGCGVQVVSRVCLERLDREVFDPAGREHVLLHIAETPAAFCVAHATDASCDAPDLRLTVDYPEDLQLMRAIYERLYPADPHFGLDDVLALRKREPDLFELNSMRKIH